MQRPRRRCSAATWESAAGSLSTGIHGLNTLDLVEPRDPAYAARALGRSLTSTLRDREIRVLTPEDFVLFKVLSTRALDLEDAASVLRSLGEDLDRELLHGELDALAETVTAHPIRERWEQVQRNA